MKRLWLILFVLPLLAQEPLKYSIHFPEITQSNMPVLFLMHGYGNNEKQFNRLIKELNNKYLIVSMRAPFNFMVIKNRWYEYSISDGDTLSQYNLLLAEGHSLYKKGNKNGLWDAIQKYNKAAQLRPRLGEAHYYIGLSYHKIGDTDFDLIIESYEKALGLSLRPDIMQKTKEELSLALEREKRLKDFWK